MALTDTRIRSAKARGKAYKLSDGGGMYLLVTTDGARYWRLDIASPGSVGRSLSEFIPQRLCPTHALGAKRREHCWRKAMTQA